MNNDKVRAEFEEWAAADGLPITWLCECGFYDARATEQAWQAWQASRAALVVELPVERDGYAQAFSCYSVDDITDALDAAGVAYK